MVAVDGLVRRTTLFHFRKLVIGEIDDFAVFHLEQLLGELEVAAGQRRRENRVEGDNRDEPHIGHREFGIIELGHSVMRSKWA